jgi:hypothetical protein
LLQATLPTIDATPAAQTQHDSAHIAQEKKKKKKKKRPTGSKGKKPSNTSNHNERRLLAKRAPVGLAGDPHSL